MALFFYPPPPSCFPLYRVLQSYTSPRREDLDPESIEVSVEGNTEALDHRCSDSDEDNDPTSSDSDEER